MTILYRVVVSLAIWQFLWLLLSFRLLYQLWLKRLWLDYTWFFFWPIQQPLKLKELKQHFRMRFRLGSIVVTLFRKRRRIDKTLMVLALCYHLGSNLRVSLDGFYQLVLVASRVLRRNALPGQLMDLRSWIRRGSCFQNLKDWFCGSVELKRVIFATFLQLVKNLLSDLQGVNCYLVRVQKFREVHACVVKVADPNYFIGVWVRIFNDGVLTCFLESIFYAWRKPNHSFNFEFVDFFEDAFVDFWLFKWRGFSLFCLFCLVFFIPIFYFSAVFVVSGDEVVEDVVASCLVVCELDEQETHHGFTEKLLLSFFAIFVHCIPDTHEVNRGPFGCVADVGLLVVVSKANRQHSWHDLHEHFGWQVLERINFKDDFWHS